jgi:hypothetical protein
VFSTGPSSPLFGQPVRLELANDSPGQMSFDRIQLTHVPDTNSTITTIGTSLANGSFETPRLGGRRIRGLSRRRLGARG